MHNISRYHVICRGPDPRHRSQTVDISAIGNRVVFGPGPSDRQCRAPSSFFTSAYRSARVAGAEHFAAALLFFAPDSVFGEALSLGRLERRSRRGPAYGSKKAGMKPAFFPYRSKSSSVPRGDRATPAEAVVHADLDGMLVVPEPGADDWSGAAGEGGAAEVVILVFGLGGPVRREHVFETSADGVAVLARAVGGKCCGHAGDTDADIVVVAPRVAALGVEQRRTPSVAEPAGGRTKLVVYCGDHSATRKNHAIVAVVGKPAVLGFSADHPLGCELVIEAALHAPHKPAPPSLKPLAPPERPPQIPPH